MPITIQDVQVITTQPATQRLLVVKGITSQPGLYGLGCATFTQRWRAVVAAIELERYLGPQTWLYTGEPFEFTRQHIDELRALEVPRLADPTRYWLLAEEGDETLDYRQAVRRYAGAKQTVLPGGDHSFTRWEDYLDDVLAFAGLR